MHIHSKYSWDGKMEIETIARILYQNGFEYGAITDHVEFSFEQEREIHEKIRIRNLEIDELNKKYEGKIELLKGVEISEPHFYKDQVNRLEELDLDIMLGSVHAIDKNALTDYERKKEARKYYQNILKMIEANQVDVIAHLDYINRYYKKDYADTIQILEVLKALAESGLALEINTSAERRASLNLFPSIGKIANYVVQGGRIVTIGSDAHRPNELNDNFEQAEFMAKEVGLKPVVYRKRIIEKI